MNKRHIIQESPWKWPVESLESTQKTTQSKDWRELDLQFGDIRHLQKLIETAQHLHKFAQLIHRSAKDPSITIEKLRRELSRIRSLNNTILSKSDEILCKALLLTASRRKVILEDIQNVQITVGKKAEQESVKCSTTIALAQFINLFISWKDIWTERKWADNCAQKVHEVEAKIEENVERCKELQRLIAQYKKTSKEEDQDEILRTIAQKQIELHKGYLECVKQINSARLDIDGIILKLQLEKAKQSEAISLNLARAGKSARQMIGCKLESSGMAFGISPVDIAKTVAFSLISGGNYLIESLGVDRAEKKVDKLVAKLQQLERALDELEVIKQTALKFLQSHVHN